MLKIFVDAFCCLNYSLQHSPKNITHRPLSSKILLMHGIVILKDITLVIVRSQDYPMCLLHASQIVLDKSPSIIFKRSQEYVVETCFIRREDRFISHPCCISASSKSPPSPLPFSYLILIQAQGFLQNHFEISLELHFYPQVSLLLLPLLSVQQSKEIPI